MEILFGLALGYLIATQPIKKDDIQKIVTTKPIFKKGTNDNDNKKK